jgi:uncharacterized membrane protein YphA (DoxX/SURF4 family)
MSATEAHSSSRDSADRSFRSVPDIGYRVYGLAALALGVIGLVWGDFAAGWQPVPAGIPHRALLAWLVGATELFAGAALLWRRTAVTGAVILTAVDALNVILLHIPRALAQPMVFDRWANIAESSAVTMGGLLAYTILTGRDGSSALRRTGWVIFGLCCLVFGAVHFIYLKAVADWVPKYLPFGQYFWAQLTGVAHIAAGLAILSGVRARLAAQLLTVMFLVFQLLIHIPFLLADPRSHFNWTINAWNLALTGAAWIVANSLREGTVRKQ